MNGAHTSAALVATGLAAGVTWPWAAPAIRWALSPLTTPYVQGALRVAGSAGAHTLADSQWAEYAAEHLPVASARARDMVEHVLAEYPFGPSPLLGVTAASLALLAGYLIGTGRIGPPGMRRKAARGRRLALYEELARKAVTGGDGALRLVATDLRATTQETQAWSEAWLHAARLPGSGPHAAWEA